MTYAINRPADITPGPLSFSLEGLTFDVRTPRGAVHVRSSLVGRPNVYNILAAVSTATALGLSFDAIESGITALKGVPGRFQVVSDPKDELTVVVDYAHTDDALRNLLETARPLRRGPADHGVWLRRRPRSHEAPADGRGRGTPERRDRHHLGQPREARIRTGSSTRFCVALPSDTRRNAGQRVLAIVDRREAIAKAIGLARPGDVVLVAGKGHEKYQVIGDRLIPFRRCGGRA